MNSTNKQTQPVALVTGAARRIGRIIAQSLHQAGFQVIIHYHTSQQAAEALVQTMNQTRPNSALAIGADLMNTSTGPHLIDACVNAYQRLDLLVNNASVFFKTNMQHGLSFEQDFDQLFTLHVKTPFYLSHAALPFLQKTQGSIINLTDIHAKNPLKDYSIYCQSKAALWMQTKSLAREFAPLVRVNAIAPGAMIWPEKENALSSSQKQQIIEQTPLKRHGEPSQIAQAVLSLAQNTFITGQMLCVDGGRSIVSR